MIIPQDIAYIEIINMTLIIDNDKIGKIVSCNGGYAVQSISSVERYWFDDEPFKGQVIATR